jgi:cytochrome c oxidase subunit 1
MVMPMFINGLGNILIIICIGNSDVSYPRCNNISVIIYIITYKFIISSILMEYNNGVGWTIYPPLSTISITISNIEIISIIISIIGLGISSSYTFVNIIITIINNKVQCYNYNLLIVYIHSILIVSILLCLVLPVLTITLIMLILDIYSNSMYYDIIFGGDSIFYQHLFWFFGHPEVYILIIPSFGVINYCINSIVYKLYNKVCISISKIVISNIGIIVWCHHMYIVGLDNDTKAYYTCITLIISLPTGCKIFNWFITLISSY